MSDLLIRNCNVLTISVDEQVSVLEAQDIIVRNNLIDEIRPTGEVDASHFRNVLSGNGLLAMPGLINCHAHVAMNLFRGLAEDVSTHRWFNDYIWLLEKNLQAGDVYWGMQLGLAEMIRAGVTTVADHYFYMDEAAQAVDMAGTRALLGWAMFGSEGQAKIDRTGEFVKEWDGAANGRIRTIMAPHAPYTCDDDFLRATSNKAKELGVGIHIHASEQMPQTLSSLEKRGITPIQVLEQTGVLDVPVIIAHGCGLLPEDIELLRNYQAGVACAAKTYLKHAHNTTPVLELRKAGIPVGLASDGAVSNNTLDIFEVMRLMAMMQKYSHGDAEVMTMSETLGVATRSSACTLGMANNGALEPGFLADLILVDLSGMHHQPLHSVTASLVYNMRGDDVKTVIVDGKVIMKDRVLLTLDEGEIVEQAKSRMTRLSQRNPALRLQTYAP